MKSKHIIFVHGLFGWGPGDLSGLPYWGEATRQFGHFTVHEARCGPVSSFHDRACEVYAQIKGVAVDYGKEHSDSVGHTQTNQAFAPYVQTPFVQDWSAENPVILIGHSAGAQTCMQLQQLLAERFWGGETSADWIEAIICVAGVINGSTLPYLLGCDKATGQLRGPVGNFLGNSLQLAALAGGQFTETLYRFYLDQWFKDAKVKDYTHMQEVLNQSNFVQSGDNLAFDLTLQGCQLANQRFHTNPNSYYLSLLTSQTAQLKFLGYFVGKGLMNPLLKASADYQDTIVQFDPEHPPLPSWGSEDLNPELWRENDGAVSTISQRYPFTGGEHSVGSKGFLSGETIEKGKWYYEYAEKCTQHSFDHLDVVFGYNSEPLSGLVKAHQKLYQNLYARLCSLS